VVESDHLFHKKRLADDTSASRIDSVVNLNKTRGKTLKPSEARADIPGRECNDMIGEFG